MKAIETKIPGVLIIDTDVFGDHRGYFTETYNKLKYEALDITTEFVQDNMNFSSQKGTLRGLHWQNPPYVQAKLVSCTKGIVIDVASSVIASLENDRSNGKIINLGSGVGTSVIEITNILKRAYNSSSEISVTGDFRIGDIANNVVDITKAERILGFKKTISLEDGLTAFCNWVQWQEHDNSGYEKSLDEMKNAGMFVR